MVTLTERTIMKSRSGVYSDTAENRRKHRVGQKYGAEKQPEDGEKTEKKETDPAKELEAVNKVIAAINEGKLNLPAAEVIKLSEKKQKLEAAKKQAEKINAGVKANEEKKNAEEAKETSKKINEAQKKERLQSLDSELEQLEEKRKKALRDRFYISSKDEEGEELNRKEINDLSDKIDKLRKEKAKLEGKKKKEESSSKKSDEMDSGEKTESPKEKGQDELASAREELQRHKDKKDSWISKYGKNSYDTRLQQIKDNVERLKNKARSEKEKKADEKNSKKAAEMKDRVKGSDKYDEMTEKGTKANEDRQKRIDAKRKDGFLPIGGGQVAKVDEVTKDGDLKITMYNGDDEWKDIAKKGSQIFEELKDSYNSKSEAEESYTRVKFDDVPNSGKINLKKYLSDKVRKGVDEKWSNIKNIPTENLKKMEKGLVNDLNKNFEAIKKSQRAELLYSIMKVKGELESRGKETQKKE